MEQRSIWQKIIPYIFSSVLILIVVNTKFFYCKQICYVYQFL